MPNHDTALVDRLAFDIDDVKKSLRQLRDEAHEADKSRQLIAEQITRIAGKVDGMAEAYAVLSRLIRDGNGQPSILQKLAAIEASHLIHDRQLRDLQQQCDIMTTAKTVTRGQMVLGIAGMLVTALLSLIGAVASMSRG